MISIANADRDKAVEFLRSYASLLQEHGMHTTREVNARRMALKLANKIERKPMLTDTSKSPTQSQK